MLICHDCVIAAVNDDYSGLSEARFEAVRAGILRCGWIVVKDHMPDESTDPCDCCGLGDGLDAHRYLASNPWERLRDQWDHTAATGVRCADAADRTYLGGTP